MEDKFTRYSKLYVLIFLLILSIPIGIGLIIALCFGVSKLVSSAPVDIVYELLIISLPATIFSTAYIIFYKRTKTHPVSTVRIISRIFFAIGLLISFFFLVLDIKKYLTIGGHDINGFLSFSIPFLAGNIGGLFLIALMQAFTTQKEKDWLERQTEREIS